MDAIKTMLVPTEIADKESSTVLASCNSVLDSVKELLDLIEDVAKVRLREFLTPLTRYSGPSLHTHHLQVGHCGFQGG
jgi:hypothetical protein